MKDEDLIPLSALQHYAFCPRQCALIHNEQVWSENWLTAQGRQLHQRVDHAPPETRKGIRYERGVEVSAPKIGLVGKLDLLEIEIAKRRYMPIEYKRGKPKRNTIDEIQLCGQVLCLEEMLDLTIPYGAIWYWQTRQRQVIEMTEALRQETMEIIQKTRQLLQSNVTPKVKYEKRCDACSLFEICQPKLSFRDKSRAYVESLYDETRLDEEIIE